MDLDSDPVNFNLTREEAVERERRGRHTRSAFDSSKLFASLTVHPNGTKRWSFFYRAHATAPYWPLVALNVGHLFGPRGEVMWRVVPCSISYEKAERRAKQKDEDSDSDDEADAEAPPDLEPFDHDQLYLDLVHPGNRV
jgi:hypothetical protein